jgi:HPt (histidine-containing phosphotransfer) domain-containing protein
MKRKGITMFVEENVWMEYLAGSKDLFKIVGESFVKDYASYHSEIVQNIRDKKIDDLHNQLHSLKGITLNLGMKKLYDQTENTLIPIRKDIIDTKEFDELLKVFDASYLELKDVLANM